MSHFPLTPDIIPDTIIDVKPSIIQASIDQIVTVVGASMNNVSGDPAAFIVAVSCSAPDPIRPTPLNNTSIAAFFSSSSIIIATVQAPHAQGGKYQLCVRWSSSSAYVTASNSLRIVSVDSLKPNVIGSMGLVQSIVVTGVNLPNVSGDGQAFVLSSSISCSSLASASVYSEFTNSSLLTLFVSDSGSAAGIYALCLRTSPTNAYFPTGMDVTIGIFCVVLIISFMTHSVFLALSLRSYYFKCKSQWHSTFEWSSRQRDWNIDASCQR